MEESKKTLKHFTNVSALKKILQTGLKFSDGKNWIDKDDRFAFEFYYKKIDAFYLKLYIFSRKCRFMYFPRISFKKITRYCENAISIVIFFR